MPTRTLLVLAVAGPALFVAAGAMNARPASASQAIPKVLVIVLDGTREETFREMWARARSRT
jgi:hypothetical protein